MELEGNSLFETVKIMVKNYAHEFGYIKKHVSYYYNNEYSILLYKENECIEELLIDITKIDFWRLLYKI